MAKAPADQFYWNDWLSDVELQSACSSTRGIWMNALCRMWFSQTQGELSGTEETLSRILNCTIQEFDTFWKEAQALGFCYSKREPNGILIVRNRRMWKKAKEREINNLRQKRFYDRHKNNGQPNGKPNGYSSSSSSSSSNNNCPQSEIVDLFKQIIPEVPKPRDWGPERQTLLRARWNEEEKRQNIEWWENLFRYIRGCPFLMGEVDPAPGHKRFFVSLPWLVKKANLLKVIEGNYEADK